MYSTCIFCHADLGKNESVEHFPIGRRLAFDGARGRLWVVCRKCERWNLTPLEERWEAIEECERLFRDTKLRVSTEHVGLARLREGLEVVRIGAPQRPEMAAWRYGDQFGRRRRRSMIYTGAAVTAVVALSIGQMTGAFIAGGALVQVINLGRQTYIAQRARVRLSIPGRAEPIKMRTSDLHKTWIEPHDSGWALNICHARAGSGGFISPARTSFSLVTSKEVDEETLTGDDALRALASLLPAINESGGSKNQVNSAVDLLEHNERDALLSRWIEPRVAKAHQKKVDPTSVLRLASFPREYLLALEMTMHEESERRAMEGELNVLEEMWRQAEEVAAIADDMFVSDETRRQLDTLRGSGDER